MSDSYLGNQLNEVRVAEDMSFFTCNWLQILVAKRPAVRAVQHSSIWLYVERSPAFWTLRMKVEGSHGSHDSHAKANLFHLPKIVPHLSQGMPPWSEVRKYDIMTLNRIWLLRSVGPITANRYPNRRYKQARFREREHTRQSKREGTYY